MAVLGLAISSPSWAFEWITDDDRTVCLWWRQRNVPFYINEECSADTALADCLEAVQASFSVWQQPDCSDLSFQYQGLTEARSWGVDQWNLIYWEEDEWDDQHGKTIAFTHWTLIAETGELVDVDIELNGVDHIFSVESSATVMQDIRNVLTHEVGHLVGLSHPQYPECLNVPDADVASEGLGHPPDTEATMFCTADLGEIKKRDLSQDDIDGLCYLYPEDRGLPTCFLQEGEVKVVGGCACGNGPGPTAGIGLWVLVAVLATQRRRRSII